MANHESLDSNSKPQAERQSIFDRPFSRRKVVTGAGVTAIGLAAVGFVGCGSESDKGSGGNVTENPTPTPETDFKVGEAVVFLDALPNGLDEITIANAIPQNLVIRKGSSLVTKAMFLTDEGKRHAIVTITDPARVNSTGQEEVFTGIIQDKLSDDQKGDGMSSYADLVGVNGSKYEVKNDKSSLEIKDGHKKFLPMVSVDTVAEDKIDAGIFYVDRDPLKKDHPLLENPVVTQPDVSVVPEGSTFTKTADGRVVAKDASGAEIARARYYPWKKEWKWVKDPESVSDYTIREYADASNFTFGLFDGDIRTLSERAKEQGFGELVDKMGNQLVMAGIEMKTVFTGYTQADWRNVLSNWDRIQTELKNGKNPTDLKYSWSISDPLVSFAANHGMKIRSQYLLWGNDIPDTLVNSGFSNEELTNLIEFTVRARVNRYKGKVDEWTVVGEAAPHILSRDGKTSLIYDKLGVGIIDKIAAWTHESDPETKLVAVEDHVIEGSSMPNAINFFKQTTAKTFEMLQHYKDANVPISKFGIENNLWIYAAPTRDQMVATLRKIQNMGFEIASAEANVGTYKDEGFYAALKTNNPAPNPFDLQAEVFANLVSAYLEVGADFALGGLTDATVWTAAKHPETKAAVFDENKKPKPAYFAMRDVIKSKVLANLTS